MSGRPRDCVVEGEHLVLDDGTTVAESSATYLPPVSPGTIVCVHLNYRSRADEFGVAIEGAHPTYFLKPPTAINAHGGNLVRPEDCALMNYEGEIAAVVGRPMRRVRPRDAWDYLAGFACANDVGVHDFRDTDAGSMLRVKGQDGFCPIGPGVVSGVDVRRSTLSTYVNGEKVQSGAVAEMVWDIGELLADITRHITLRPGDIVLTGTPWHSRPVFPGDLVEVEVDGLGRLSNRVVEGPSPENHSGFPATVTKTSLGVALGSDYHVLKARGTPPSADQYRSHRTELVTANMTAARPPRRGPS
ncbi:MAG TPA: fumarylacetoacetate hydrolase family protein [Polyangiaceae bacterium]|nr:fumarylacetoacetate hydrolase family protein [Polyangiaceae bacterium]